jgi:cell division protein FtsB
MPNAREYGALDYEVQAFLKKAYNRKMEKLEAEKNK